MYLWGDRGRATMRSMWSQISKQMVADLFLGTLPAVTAGDVEAQRVRRVPPSGSVTASRRTPFCACYLEAQRVRRAPTGWSVSSRRTPFCACSLEDEDMSSCQNVSFMLNCIILGAPKSPVAVVRIWPNWPLVRVTFGLPGRKLLVRLNASARTSSP